MDLKQFFSLLRENKFKYLFRLTLISFIVFICYSYLMKEMYELNLSLSNWTINQYESDIRMIDEIIFHSDLSKRQIDSILIEFDPSDGDYYKTTKDTNHLENTYLLFKKDKLISIRNK